jgi:hypothetical protein
MVQDWVGQKLLNVTFEEFFDVGFHKYLRWHVLENESYNN